MASVRQATSVQRLACRRTVHLWVDMKGEAFPGVSEMVTSTVALALPSGGGGVTGLLHVSP